jgi:hypothetical protein
VIYLNRENAMEKHILYAGVEYQAVVCETCGAKMWPEELLEVHQLRHRIIALWAAGGYLNETVRKERLELRYGSHYRIKGHHVESRVNIRQHGRKR